MTSEQLDNMLTDIVALRHMVIALALASPKLENVVAEIERQRQTGVDALLAGPISDQHIEMIDSKLKAFQAMLTAQL